VELFGVVVDVGLVLCVVEFVDCSVVVFVV